MTTSATSASKRLRSSTLIRESGITSGRAEFLIDILKKIENRLDNDEENIMDYDAIHLQMNTTAEPSDTRRKIKKLKKIYKERDEKQEKAQKMKEILGNRWWDYFLCVFSRVEERRRQREREGNENQRIIRKLERLQIPGKLLGEIIAIMEHDETFRGSVSSISSSEGVIGYLKSYKQQK